jgi:ABC-type nickel/cobalt efflux system permease component RcnA
VNKLLQEIPKGALNTLGAALGVLILSLGSKAIRSALGLSLSDTEVSSIQFWLLCVGIGLILSVGWFLFFRLRRKFKVAEQQLREMQTRLDATSKSDHRFQDDYLFDARLGLYKHKNKSGFFCASCTPKGIESPLHQREDGWRCQIQECCKWHSNPDYKSPPKQRFSSRSWTRGDSL